MDTNDKEIHVIFPDMTNMYLYPAMEKFVNAVNNRSGFCYDAYNSDKFTPLAVVEFENSIAAWLGGEEFNIRKVNIIKSVPILIEPVAYHIENKDTIFDSIIDYNSTEHIGSRRIRSYMLTNVGEQRVRDEYFKEKAKNGGKL